MPSGYYRFPTIHAETIVFVCEDDLWAVPASGGIARRLSANLGEVSRPSFSPDGELLAFVGREEGQSEIYIMPALGGPARRLTFMGGSLCQTSGWTRSGKIIFANNAGHWYLRFTHLYSLDPQGGQPERLNFGLARTISFGPEGGVVIGRNTDDPARWKRYRGGTTGQIWIDTDGDGDFSPLIQLQGNLTSPIWITAAGTPGRIYFISDHEGIGNLYSCLPSGQDLKRHTDHEQYYVRHASSDGQHIVYHAGADLYLFDPGTEKEAVIPVEWRSPQTQRNRKFVDAGQYLESSSLHPQGQAVAIASRGKVFTFANWEGAVIAHDHSASSTNSEPTSASVPKTGIRFRLPHWLNNGERLVAVTDEGGEERFLILSADGVNEPQRLPDLDIGRPEAIAVNPCKDQLVFSNHRYELMFLDLQTQELRLIDRGVARPISGFCWSPDGEWVAYSLSISLQLTILKLWNASSGEITILTEPVLRDVAPAFDPLGRYLYFLSYRYFDPVYDNLQFDLNFPRGMRPYLITLQKDQTSPFIPKPRAPEPRQKDEDEDTGSPDAAFVDRDQEPGSPGADGQETTLDQPEKTNGAPLPSEADEELAKDRLHIDLEGISRRVIAFPVGEGRYGRILGTKDGKVLYSRYPIEGALNQPWPEYEPPAKGTLLVYNFEDQKEDTLIYGISDFDLSRDAVTLIYRAGSRLRVLKAGEKPDDKINQAPSRKSGWLDLNRVKVSVLPGSEWRQMFRESWRLQRDQFWTPDMSLVNWLTIHDRYLSLVDRVSSRSEFSDLMWEMQGELGTSHAYELGGDYRPEPAYYQGFLGADFLFDSETGGWRITNLLHGDAWEARSDSPLNGPGVNVKVNDLLVAINGQKLSQTISPAACLVNLAGEEVTLTFALYPEAPEKGYRNVTVRTLRSEVPSRYRQWVEQNRQRIHNVTDGRIGYIHIPDMGAWGFAEFHRGYLAEVDRQGLIVDVRFNRGGHVSSLLLEKLARRRLGYDTARWSQVPAPYPLESVAGPMVALTNEFAGSDGDIFSHGFKMLKLGPLIGKRTWGGVIGIDPRHFLVDGTVTTQPEFSFWFSDVGWGVENYGTDPDIEIDITPQDYARNFDPQLERSIEVILELLANNPPVMPEFLNKPSRALPKLPRR